MTHFVCFSVGAQRSGRKKRPFGRRQNLQNIRLWADEGRLRGRALLQEEQEQRWAIKKH